LATTIPKIKIIPTYTKENKLTTKILPILKVKPKMDKTEAISQGKSIFRFHLSFA
jgi:hypothetical protein